MTGRETLRAYASYFDGSRRSVGLALLAAACQPAAPLPIPWLARVDTMTNALITMLIPAALVGGALGLVLLSLSPRLFLLTLLFLSAVWMTSRVLGGRLGAMSDTFAGISRSSVGGSCSFSENRAHPTTERPSESRASSCIT